MAGKLSVYRSRRRFGETPEPEGARRSPRRTKGAGRAGDESKRRARGDAAASSRGERAARSGRAPARGRSALHYVIQEHHARRLHYDFRLELDGTLKSWAIPKGPSLDPSVKRLAVHVEDHPLEYAAFEGEIPEGHYGAGSVIVWDRGAWTPAGGVAAARAGYRAGKLSFTLDGDKLHGGWALVRGRGLRDSGGKHEQWLLIKERDGDARDEADYDVLRARPGSVLGGARSARARRGRAAEPTERDAAAPKRARASVPKGRAEAKTSGRAPRTVSNGTAGAGKGASKRASKREGTNTGNGARSGKGSGKGAGEGGATPRRKRAAAPQSFDVDSADTDSPAARGLALPAGLAARFGLSGAKRAALPRTLRPQLATLVDAPPPGKDWLYEAKFDGYRVLIRIDRGAASRPIAVYTREGLDWSAKFAAQLDALARLPVDRGWLDGEAVVLDRAGVPDFQALQNALGAGRSNDVTLFLFDVPFLNGFDLRGVPLERRRALLAALVAAHASDVLRYSESLAFEAADLLTGACDAGLEGLIGKRRDGRYVEGRSRSWIKLKCRRRQEFVIGGYTEPAGRRSGFGALLLGVYARAPGDEGERRTRGAAETRDERRRASHASRTSRAPDAGAARAPQARPLALRYVGRVGTGFGERTLRALARTLREHETGRMPFADVPRERSGTPVHWVKPVLVAECEFAEWTGDGIVRQASFVGLREDKPARTIVREQPQSMETEAMNEHADEHTDEHTDARAERRTGGRTRRKARDGGARDAPPLARHPKRGDAGSSARKGARDGEAGKRAAAGSSPSSSPSSSTSPSISASGRTRGGGRSASRDRAGDADEGANEGANDHAPRERAGAPKVAGVRVSHPGRMIDPHTGTRKLDLVEYWEWIAPWLLPHLKGRPVSLVRAPADIGGELFFQKHADKLEIPNVALHAGLDPGHEALITIDDVKGLVGAAQMGTIELHTWNAHVSNIEKPDRAVFDLDPDPSLDWRAVIEAAQLTRALLDELGLVSFCKTSGGKGLHVVVPLARHAGWDDVKAFAHAVARHMAATLPECFTATMGPRNRKGKIFVDYLRNNRGASTIAAYSVRARPGLGVSVPIAWDELPDTTGAAQWTLANLHERLDALKHDPWRAYAHVRQRVTAALRKRLSDG
ncbi:DNA ligase [Burkholderia pseudomallei]|uniref:non-homologous end-joining DNA ligase n=1 Tax=Burkholderia pseudomallei TaxID=28450 RepID=UPI00046517B2|nr:non-homologous end-joining DNA ligase [Burkholderia pseudomallei]AIP20165.1 DNA ligase D [Burkholderia pseudomallei MSHR5855]AIP42060.1 DNA ligase D [Burkholderia pseudomallei MSHR5848]APF96043.1 DNA ligase [Burkholderia pseudomallei]APG02086.1 DNA ligase [Burkholderia pseudomallei]KEO66395.1 DNA ligase [Burkholderia pseudomallei MSHR5855]